MSTATHTKQANALNTIDDMLKSIGETKVAESNTEAGGYDGPTEHPIKKEDDRTEPAYEGSRAQENEEDVREEQSPNEVVGENPIDKSSTEKAALGLPGNQDDVQLNIGTLQKATGEDPKSETGKAKGGKEDGGYQGSSTHPARTDNEEIDGHKYASAIATLTGQIKAASDLGNDAIAAISVSADGVAKEKVAAMQKAAMEHCPDCHNKPCTCPAGKHASDNTETLSAETPGESTTPAEKAGAALAEAVSGEVPSSDKQAQTAQVVEDLAQTVLNAYSMADKTAEFLRGFREGTTEGANNTPAEKSADYHDENNGEETPGTNEPRPEEETGAPPAEYGGGMNNEGPSEGGGEEAALLEALAGGGGGGGGMGMGMGGEMGGEMGGGMPGAEMGGMMGGEMGGGMPGAEMGGGGMPGAEMGGMGGAPSAIGQEELMMLAAALDEAGITPQALEAAATAKAAHDLSKQASKVERSSNWRPKTAQEATRYQAILNHVKEVCAVS